MRKIIGNQITVKNTATYILPMGTIVTVPCTSPLVQLYVHDGVTPGGLLVGGSSIINSGITAARPAQPSAGQTYFDTTLNIAIWYNGVHWVNAIGTTV